jgi:hypothetical protein
LSGVNEVSLLRGIKVASQFFIVTANGPTGPISMTCETPAAAHEAALGMLARGIEDVLIADPDGVQYAVPEFRLRFVTDR